MSARNRKVPVRSPNRCECATSELMIAYHDGEWGVPVRDDLELFELVTLEGAQAGLSWETILKKRDGYREAFADFDSRRSSGSMLERSSGSCKMPASFVTG